MLPDAISSEKAREVSPTNAALLRYRCHLRILIKYQEPEEQSATGAPQIERKQYGVRVSIYRDIQIKDASIESCNQNARRRPKSARTMLASCGCING